MWDKSPPQGKCGRCSRRSPRAGGPSASCLRLLRALNATSSRSRARLLPCAHHGVCGLVACRHLLITPVPSQPQILPDPLRPPQPAPSVSAPEGTCEPHGRPARPHWASPPGRVRPHGQSALGFPGPAATVPALQTPRLSVCVCVCLHTCTRVCVTSAETPSGNYS